MQYENPLAIVQAWQEASNRQDIDRLLELSDPDIAMVGPRGTAHGHQVLRDWIGRANLSLETLRAFARGNAVVLAQRGVWHSTEAEEVTGEQNVASRFQVENQRVTLVARHDRLELALEEARLHFSDEVTPKPQDEQLGL